MIIGIYFVRSGKLCPVCGEKVARNEPDCKYCAYIFKDDALPPRIWSIRLQQLMTFIGQSAILRRFRVSRPH
jgi:hypothetical protein